MKVLSTARLEKMKMLDLLEYAFTSDFPIGHGPRLRKPKRPMNYVHQVERDVIARMFLLWSKLGPDYNAFKDIFWHGIVEEFPACYGNNLKLCYGWKIAREGRWASVDWGFEPSSVIMNYTRSLRDIMFGMKIDTDEDKLGPICSGEHIVGTVENPKAQTLYNLCLRLTEEYDQIPNMHDGLTIRGLTREEIEKAAARENRIRMITERYDVMTCVTASLFWQTVFDDNPELRGTSKYFGVRRAWQIVQTDIDIADDGEAYACSNLAPGFVPGLN